MGNNEGNNQRTDVLGFDPVCTVSYASYVPKITEINVLRDGRVMRCELAGYEKDIDYARFKHEKSRTIQSITVQSQ